LLDFDPEIQQHSASSEAVQYALLLYSKQLLWGSSGNYCFL